MLFRSYFICIFVGLAPLRAHQLDCRFEFVHYYGPFGRHYSCRSLEYNALCDERSVTSVTGAHEPGKTHDDVNQVFIDNQHSECIPQGLSTFFENLLVLCVRNSHVSELHSNDLQGLSNLKILDLGFNKIDSIPANFFDETPNIEQISFLANKVKYVAIRILPELRYVTDFYMGGNKCVSMDVRLGNQDQLRNLHALTKVDCRPPLNSNLSGNFTVNVPNNVGEVNICDQNSGTCNVNMFKKKNGK